MHLWKYLTAIVLKYHILQNSQMDSNKETGSGTDLKDSNAKSSNVFSKSSLVNTWLQEDYANNNETYAQNNQTLSESSTSSVDVNNTADLGNFTTESYNLTDGVNEDYVLPPLDLGALRRGEQISAGNGNEQNISAEIIKPIIATTILRRSLLCKIR
jgi:hypothetical protein